MIVNKAKKPALLALADGTVFTGHSIGAEGSTVGEVVFNTSMTGYQEILTDPSYARQIVTLTYPHIGNVGINSEDEEAGHIVSAGLIIRDLSLVASNFRSEQSLDQYLQKHNIKGIAGIDTRALTRHLREHGAQSGCIMAGSIDAKQAIAEAKAFGGLKGLDLAKEVSCASSYTWSEGVWALGEGFVSPKKQPFKVVAYDFGVKRNILRLLVDRGCDVTVVPATTPVSDVLAMEPDGVFLSNGPGDPEPCDYAIDAIRVLLDQKMPLFGICLGHQLLALAVGARTVKMKFGHHGGNHPVQDLVNKTVMITSQNHGFAVDVDSLPDHVTSTHISLFDGSSQGIELTDRPAFSFQGHPEASPGPHDADHLFDHFIALMRQRQGS